MGALIADYWIWFFFAFLIGIATAWWVWGRIVLPDADAPSESVSWSADAGSAASQLAAAPSLEAAPETLDEPAPAPAAALATPAAPLVAPAVGAPDDLLLIKGIGPQLNALLNSLGVTRFDQIAGWSLTDVQRVDAHLGVFKGRIVRDDWIEQARLLAAGDIAGYSAKYGNPESK